MASVVLLHETEKKGRNGRKGKKKTVNAMDLATSVLARIRNKPLSALTYRISVILFHGGLRMSETIRPNHLGVSMSSITKKQMGSGSDTTVLIWKKSIVEVLRAVHLLQEARRPQVPEFKG